MPDRAHIVTDKRK